MRGMMEQSYCSHPHVDYFPTTARPDLVYSFHPTAVHQRLHFILMPQTFYPFVVTCTAYETN